MVGRWKAQFTAEPALLPALLLLVAAVLLGGGGSPGPLSELLLETCAGACALAWLWTAQLGKRSLRDQLPLLLLVALVLILPVLQLLPLPPAVWEALPGRAGERAALDLVGEVNSWRPLSVAPQRTLAALLALCPPLVVLALAASLGPKSRQRLVVLVAGLALLSALVGVLQVAGGEGASRLYPVSHVSGITGFQANRNAEADLLLIGLLALAASFAGLTGPGSMLSRTQLAWCTGLSLFLALAVIFTSSRAGIALLVLALAGQYLLLRRRIAQRGWRLVPAIAAAAGLAALAGLALFARNGPLLAIAERFSVLQDARTQLWADAAYAAQQYWPFGSGLGTFVPVFLAAERLEFVDPTVPNRAHNDFLELAIEGGAFGLLLLAAIALLLIVCFLRGWRRRPAERAQLLFASVSLAVIGAHSVVDYPLRSMALACLAALAAGLMVAPAMPSNRGTREFPSVSGDHSG